MKNSSEIVFNFISKLTINGAKQLGIEAAKDSITAGKDADFLVFDNDLLTVEHEGFSQNKQRDVYFGEIKMNCDFENLYYVSGRKNQ